jgi:hypothetical protein
MDRFDLYTSSVSLRLSLAAAACTRAKSDSAASAFGFCPAGYTRGGWKRGEAWLGEPRF